MKKFVVALFSVWPIVACAPIAPDRVDQSPASIAPVQESEVSVSPDSLALANLPLPDAEGRVSKKPFGLKVSPAQSPVQPERFSGYHTGVDYEISEDEASKDIFVFAVCDGEILQKRKAQGYGGVVVQSCMFGDQPVAVVYGHLALASIVLKVGDALKAGDRFATLGQAFSEDTGGERKHLHLGVKKGAVANLLGYVQKEADLQGWIDFESYRKEARASFR